jgi:hypothetical protein
MDKILNVEPQMELKAWERKQCDANNGYGAVGYGKLQTDGKASVSYVYGGICSIARSRKCESGSLLHLCDSHIHYSFHLEGLRSIACRVFMNPPAHTTCILTGRSPGI